MEVFLNSKEPEKLYTTGESRILKLEKQVVDKFFATIQKILLFVYLLIIVNLYRKAEVNRKILLQIRSIGCCKGAL